MSWAGPSQKEDRGSSQGKGNMGPKRKLASPPHNGKKNLDQVYAGDVTNGTL